VEVLLDDAEGVPVAEIEQVLASCLDLPARRRSPGPAVWPEAADLTVDWALEFVQCEAHACASSASTSAVRVG
jgi:hypothetical protein